MVDCSARDAVAPWTLTRQRVIGTGSEPLILVAAVEKRQPTVHCQQ